LKAKGGSTVAQFDKLAERFKGKIQNTQEKQTDKLGGAQKGRW